MARFATDSKGNRSIVDLPEGVRPRDRVKVKRKDGGISSVIVDLIVSRPDGTLVGYTKFDGKQKFGGRKKFAGKGE